MDPELTRDCNTVLRHIDHTTQILTSQLLQTNGTLNGVSKTCSISYRNVALQREATLQ